MGFNSAFKGLTWLYELRIYAGFGKIN